MNTDQRIEVVLELLEGKFSSSELAQRHGIAETELLAWRDTWLAGARSASRARVPQRRTWMLGGLAAAALVGLISREAMAASCAAPSLFSNLGLTYFCADDPALATEVNANTAQLVSLIEKKLGTGWGAPDAGVSTVGITTPAATVTGVATLTGGATVGTNNALSFGTQTRQMINLWSSNYGIGVQNSTLYFRTGNNFAWYVNGTHSDAMFDPGVGGVEAMRLTQNGALSVRGLKQTDSAAPVPNRYEVQRFIVDATPSMNGSAVTIDQASLEALCRDDDGCPFTISMVNHNATGTAATRSGTLFLSQTTSWWRIEYSGGAADLEGQDGAATGTTEFGVWDCYFGDATGTDANNNRTDSGQGFSLLNAKGGMYSDTTTTCRMVFRD